MSNPRGPKPKGEYAGKSKVFSTRIRPDLRAKLDEAAVQSGRSVSQEVEHRLRRTFVEDESMADAFGDRRTYLLMRIIALTLQRPFNLTKPGADWLNDAELFDEAVATATRVLGAIRPKDATRSQEDEFIDVLRKLAPPYNAISVWATIQKADPTKPLGSGTRRQHLHGVFKADLGEIASRASGAISREDGETVIEFFRRFVVGRAIPHDYKNTLDRLTKRYHQLWDRAVAAGPLSDEPRRKPKPKRSKS